MTPLQQFWRYFFQSGLQVHEATTVTKLWYLLLDSNSIPDKQSKLFQISRVVDAKPQHEPAAIRHFFRAFSPAVLVALTEEGVATRRMSRRAANAVEEKILLQTRRDGSWDIIDH